MNIPNRPKRAKPIARRIEKVGDWLSRWMSVIADAVIVFGLLLACILMLLYLVLFLVVMFK